MKLLVLGGTRFVGRHLADWLREARLIAELGTAA
jgi:nucleoside-diphosphate-sugar epimerase